MKVIPKISFREDVKSIGFECIRLTDLTQQKRPDGHHPNRPHRINFFAILIITEGAVVHQVDFKLYPLKKNDCLLISQGQVHAFDAKAKYQGHLILFTPEFLVNQFSVSSFFKTANLFNAYLSTPFYPLNKELIRDVKSLIHENERDHYILKSNIVASLFSVFLLKLNNQNLASISYKTNQGFETFEKFKSLIETEYALSRNVKDYAAKLNISYKHLNEISKRFTHKTAKELIDNHVVLEIKRKLCSTSLSMKEICFETGFDEPTNFIKYFKNISGETPLSFRSKYV
jgi:AraC family transcriptional activator of pobA